MIFICDAQVFLFFLLKNLDFGTTWKEVHRDFLFFYRLPAQQIFGFWRNSASNQVGIINHTPDPRFSGHGFRPFWFTKLSHFTRVKYEKGSWSLFIKSSILLNQGSLNRVSGVSFLSQIQEWRNFANWLVGFTFCIVLLL